MQSSEVTGQERQYLTFDDPGILAAARRDPNGFVAGLNASVTLDEIQHIPELFLVIKAAIDRDRQPGRFLLTGSANVTLLPKLSESLAGRMELLTLWPLSQGEIRGIQENFVDTMFSEKSVDWSGKSPAMSWGELLESVVSGGYPPALAAEHRPPRCLVSVLRYDGAPTRYTGFGKHCRHYRRSTAALWWPPAQADC